MLGLQVLENRIFSEGLHVLGQPPAPDQAVQYLSAYFGKRRTILLLAGIMKRPVACFMLPC